MLVGALSLCNMPARPRVQRAPGLPRALLFQGKLCKTQADHAARTSRCSGGWRWIPPSAARHALQGPKSGASFYVSRSRTKSSIEERISFRGRTGASYQMRKLETKFFVAARIAPGSRKRIIRPNSVRVVARASDARRINGTRGSPPRKARLFRCPHQMPWLLTSTAPVFRTNVAPNTREATHESPFTHKTV